MYDWNCIEIMNENTTVQINDSSSYVVETDSIHIFDSKLFRRLLHWYHFYLPSLLSSTLFLCRLSILSDLFSASDLFVSLTVTSSTNYLLSSSWFFLKVKLFVIAGTRYLTSLQRSTVNFHVFFNVFYYLIFPNILSVTSTSYPLFRFFSATSAISIDLLNYLSRCPSPSFRFLLWLSRRRLLYLF